MRAFRILLVLLALWVPSAAAATDSQRARAVRFAAAGLGAATGVWVALATSEGGAVIEPGTPRGTRIAFMTSHIAVQTASSTWATWWFADVCLRHPRGPWRSIGWGVLYGMAAGAMSFGTGFTTFIVAGWATGALRTGDFDRWWEVVGSGLLVGNAGGAITCIPVGALLAPIISLTMRF